MDLDEGLARVELRLGNLPVAKDDLLLGVAHVADGEPQDPRRGSVSFQEQNEI
jgi:hypothetical protein